MSFLGDIAGAVIGAGSSIWGANQSNSADEGDVFYEFFR
nr:MAG TPA: hypothetical protein [Microviridae sp.]